MKDPVTFKKKYFELTSVLIRIEEMKKELLLSELFLFLTHGQKEIQKPLSSQRNHAKSAKVDNHKENFADFAGNFVFIAVN